VWLSHWWRRNKKVFATSVQSREDSTKERKTEDHRDLADLLGRRLCELLLVPYPHSAVKWRIVSWIGNLVEKIHSRYGMGGRKQGSEKSIQETKISVAIRSFFAYSEGSSAGSGAGGTLPVAIRVYPKRPAPLRSVGLCVAPSYCGPEGIQNAKPQGCARWKRVLPWVAVVCEGAASTWQLAIGLVF